MNTAPLLELAGEWHGCAETLRQFCADAQADVLERCAEQLEARLREWWQEELSVAEAASESGYGESHLRRLVREQTIPDGRAPGSQGEIRIRRCDLPRKPHGNGRPDVVSELAERLGR